MTDHEALVRAVCASPDDDLPRLVLADYLEEQGDAAQAEFIRTQVQLAVTPPWEPFAVRIKHRRPELISGEPWRDTLPQFGNGIVAEWNKDGPFHRGFGHSLHVKQLTTFLEMAPHLLQVCPVQELILPSGTQDDWRNLMKAPWLANIRSVKFTFASNLIEPVRALAASDYATNIESVAFDVCTSPAMGVIVEALVQSPLAKYLKRLSFSVGNDTDGEIAEQLATVELPKLEALAFKTIGLNNHTWQHFETLKYTARIKNLHFENETFNVSDEAELFRVKIGLHLETLQWRNCKIRSDYGNNVDDDYNDMSWEYGFDFTMFSNVNRIDFSRSHVYKYSHVGLQDCEGIRSILLADCRLNSQQVTMLLFFYADMDLSEIDLTGNVVDERAIQSLLKIVPSENLQAILLNESVLQEPSGPNLISHFGDRLVLK